MNNKLLLALVFCLCSCEETFPFTSGEEQLAERPGTFNKITTGIKNFFRSTGQIFSEVAGHTSKQIEDKYGVKYPYNFILMVVGTIIMLWISTRILSGSKVSLHINTRKGRKLRRKQYFTQNHF